MYGTAARRTAGFGSKGQVKGCVWGLVWLTRSVWCHTCAQLSTHTYHGIAVTMTEGSLGDGLGVKLWSCGHILCDELAAHPSFVAGQEVLEIGACSKGGGLCGAASV